MKDLKTIEKHAIIIILTQIMKADGIIHPKEEEYMDKMFDKLNITIQDLENLSDLDDIQVKSIFDSMTPEHKKYAFALFVGMAEVDGYFDPTEKAIIDNYCETNDHKIRNYDLILDETFGKQGTPERTKAEEEAFNFYSELILQNVSKVEKP